MEQTNNTPQVSRRSWLQTMALTGGTALVTSCAKRGEPSAASGPAADYSHEEYVWMSCHANLPLFMAHDHPALRLAGQQLGVQVTVGGPNTSDIPSLISCIETTAAAGGDDGRCLGPIRRRCPDQQGGRVRHPRDLRRYRRPGQ
jgi:hypothetical protein